MADVGYVDASNRNYANLFGSSSSSSNTTVNGIKLDTSGETDSGLGIDASDFLNLMVLQLTNQDFTNPVDDTQYLSQLAQFATMYQMQDLADYSHTNYVAGLVGKNVSISEYKTNGEIETITGTVDAVSFLNNTYKVYVNGIAYDAGQISVINDSSDESNSSGSYSADEISEAYKKGYTDAVNELFGSEI